MAAVLSALKLTPDAAIEECHLIIEQGAIVGRITSVAYSPHRAALIGLAMLDIELAEVGREISVRTTDGTVNVVTQVDTPFYDPDNSAQQVSPE